MKGVHPMVEEAFSRGSKTYFNSSLFFPESVRRDVFLLYGFVRTADDFVDAIPPQEKAFRSFRRRYEQARACGGMTGDPIIDSFLDVSRRKGFQEAWVDAFLNSMEADLSKNRYDSLQETIEYIYGSAEVIGLFMAAIMGLEPEARNAAASLGRSMQYINFIRDIAEDNGLGRIYLPLKGSGLTDLREETARAHPEEFIAFIRSQAGLYLEWQAEAEAGFGWIPWRSRVPIMTASHMYNWTARIIQRDPFIVYRKKVKPKKARILFELFLNGIRAMGYRRPRQAG
jgi:15-cis-phytoene synthase